MTDTFSTPAEHAFEHDEIETIAGPSTMGDATEELSVEEAFEVEDTIRRIREGGFKTVSHLSCPYSLRRRRHAMQY
jgi:diphthamide biosynthesis protein 2